MTLLSISPSSRIQTNHRCYEKHLAYIWPSITEDGAFLLNLCACEANILVAKDRGRDKAANAWNVVTKQERECNQYANSISSFTSKGETLHDYYLRFTLYSFMEHLQDAIGAVTSQHQVHNTLPDEWIKIHANEVRLMHERNTDPLALVASHQLTQPAYQSHLHTHPKSLSQLHVSPYQSSQFVPPYQTQQFTTNQSTPLSITYPSNEYQSTIHHNVYSSQPSISQVEYAPTAYQQQQPEFSQPDSGLVVPVFQKGDDPIDAINHIMIILTAVVTSPVTGLLPTIIKELRQNPHQQATHL
ncbi:hypothetical protein Tco_1041694 [Tanacetum coccineum]|uniref:Uncharacterized protein n=1 Tax=Tanacetum coccineum TaxID=301880 RepID=A0ABQ5GI13_9ASTR